MRQELVKLAPCSEIRSVETVGLFALPKDKEFDRLIQRLILNPTVINLRCHSYSRYTKTIAPGYLILMLSGVRGRGFDIQKTKSQGPFYELLTIDDHIGVQKVQRNQPNN